MVKTHNKSLNLTVNAGDEFGWEISWGLTLNIEYERIKQVDMNVLCWFNLFD